MAIWPCTQKSIDAAVREYVILLPAMEYLISPSLEIVGFGE